MEITPRVTIFLTSYNHEKYIKQSIMSILSQTYKDFNLVIMDDGSTDGSWEIINGFEDDRIYAFRNEVNTHHDFLSILTKTHFGEYLAIHHSDDLWEPQKLEKQVKFLDENPEDGAVFTQVKVIGEEGKALADKNHKYYKVFDQPNRTRFEWLNFFFYHRNVLCHPSILIRRDCFLDLRFYRLAFSQLSDLDFWVRLCLKYEIHIIQERLTCFRVRAGEKNTSGDRADTQNTTEIEFLQILENYKKLTNENEFIKVFPKSKKYFKPEGSDIEFALAMMALEDQTDIVTKFFGLQLLFTAFNDPERFFRIRTLYNYTKKEFSELTGRYLIFSPISPRLTYKIKSLLNNRIVQRGMLLVGKVRKVFSS